MKLTKIAALLLALAMLPAIVSCMSEQNGDTTTTKPDATTTTITTTTTTTTETPDTNEPSVEYETITIAKALELCGEPGNITTDRYYIRATVKSIDNAQYGAMTIEDETGSIYVYGTYSADGSIGYSEMTEKPYKGDEVLLHCILQNYNGTKEVKNARLIEFKKVEQEFDQSEYTEMSIADARKAEKGIKIKTDGVVARITYANGQIPSGMMLVDETGSIYVYDSDLAQSVQIGNKITILADKTYWILDSEQGNAAKFGYKGCNQLESVKLVSNDEKTDNAFDKTWIPESTVKDIVDTPVTEDITSSIYKVTALVKKVPGNGFVNYYINDLDGKTGSYVYTQCNGSDFGWLDAFDGKICTVYLTALNAKSTTSECFFRLLPVLVENNGFKFDTKDTAEHVVKYYGIGQFNASYTGDPALEMITNVSSDLLGFKDAVLTYSSSDESVVKFTTADGKTVFHCKKTGSAEITVSCTFDGVTYSEKVTVSVTVNESFEYVDVKTAIDSEKGTEVTVKGIVGPSLVNQSGFYLIDETGIIAVLVDASVFEDIAVGNEIVLKGVRNVMHKKDGTHFGQSYISDVEIVANYYGDNAYSDATFISGKNLADFYALDKTEDHTTEVYIVKATIEVVETNFYTSIKLKDGDTSVSLYCSSANQYSFLKDFAGQEVTLELAPCNWNDKTYYASCALAVRTADGKVVNELNFAK